MGAALAVGHVFIFCETDEDARFVDWVVKELVTSDFDLSDFGDHLFEARCFFAKKRILDGVSACCGYHRESEEFREAAARGLVFLALANRVFGFPGWRGLVGL